MEFIQLTNPQNDVNIHDIAFDFYGKRFATCSTDAKIKIWDKGEDKQDGNHSWNSTEITDCHNGSIWRLSWAHPEYGNLIASCSEDRSIKIWEEQVGITRSHNESRDRWLIKAQLSDSKKAVNDVKFAPRHMGLKVALASGDGIVRIYEAPDVFSLNYWQLQYSFTAEDTNPIQEGAIAGTSHHSEHGLTCLAWNECVFEPAKIAVGGYSRRASVWTFDATEGGSGKWREECELGTAGESQGVVHDVAWAPAMGRSYHMIATATRETNFKIHTLNRKSDGSLEYTSTHMEHVKSPVWRVTWNVTGTVLSTSSEDGTLCLWRKDFAGYWKCVQELPQK